MLRAQNLWRCIDADWGPNSGSNGDSYLNTNCYNNVYAGVNSNGSAYVNTHRKANRRTNFGPNGHAHVRADSFADSFANRNTHRNTNDKTSLWKDADTNEYPDYRQPTDSPRPPLDQL